MCENSKTVRKVARARDGSDCLMCEPGRQFEDRNLATALSIANEGFGVSSIEAVIRSMAFLKLRGEDIVGRSNELIKGRKGAGNASRARGAG